MEKVPRIYGHHGYAIRKRVTQSVGTTDHILATAMAFAFGVGTQVGFGTDHLDPSLLVKRELTTVYVNSTLHELSDYEALIPLKNLRSNRHLTDRCARMMLLYHVVAQYSDVLKYSWIDYLVE